jgi:hypothetical protein
MILRIVRSVVAALALVAVAFVASPVKAQQVGDAFILFNIDTGEFRMNPGNPVVGSNGVNSFGVEMDPTIGTISTDVNDYFFPSGSYPLFPPQTGANPGNAFGSAFQSYSLPNVTGGGDSLNSTNLVIGSEWAYPTSVPGSTAVFASTIPGYEGLPEFSFGTFGPTDLTESQALAALGATTQGGFATGNRVYSLSGSAAGTQFFKIYTTTAVPEPSTIGLAAAGIATLGASAWRKRKLATKAKA